MCRWGVVLLGVALAPHVPDHRARRTVLRLALPSGLSTLAKGLGDL